MKRLSDRRRRWLRDAEAQPDGWSADWILHSAALPPGTRVVLGARVSSRWQNSRPQQNDLKKDAHLRQFDIVYKMREVGHGWDLTRPGLSSAIEVALNYNAVVLYDSVDRYVRNQDGGWPGAKDLRRLRQVAKAKGVTLATTVHPATPEAEIQRRQMERGQGKPGGRPVRRKRSEIKRCRDEKMPQAVKMNKAGHSYRRIGRELDVPLTTVYKWVHPA